MKSIYYLGIAICIFSCSGTKQFTEQDNHAYAALKTLVSAKSFEIQSNKANAMASTAFSQVANTGILGPGNTASSIDITSNSNYLRIKSDTIHAFLPFYGEQQFGGGSPGGTHTGIEFEGIPENYTVTENDAKHSITIQFSIDDLYRSIEHYKVYIVLFPSKRSDIQILSSSRSSMGYTGTVAALKKDEKKK